MPSARPTRAGLSPPGIVRAWTENTGRIRNSPIMRRAKIDASEALVRTSWPDMRDEEREVMREDRAGGSGSLREGVPGGGRGQGALAFVAIVPSCPFRAVGPLPANDTGTVTAQQHGRNSDPRRPHAQPQERRPRPAAAPADRDHGPVRIRQVV